MKIKALNDLRKRKVTDVVYDAFNVTLPVHGSGEHGQQFTNNFYNLLNFKGYDAIMDMNDRKYSDYKSSKPMIAFPKIASQLTVANRRKLGMDEILNNEHKAEKILNVQNELPKILGKTAVLGTGAALAGGVSRAAKNKRHNEIVNTYRKKHPNTKLSYNEIVDLYYKSR